MKEEKVMENKNLQKPLNESKQQGRITTTQPWPNRPNMPKPLQPQANNNQSSQNPPSMPKPSQPQANNNTSPQKPPKK
jgi:hypothetical protein